MYNAHFRVAATIFFRAMLPHGELDFNQGFARMAGMENPIYTQGEVYGEQDASLAKAYLNKVYLWMSVTMLVTAGVASWTTHNMDAMMFAAGHPWMLLLGGLGIVLAMSFGARALPAAVLGFLLLLFSAVEGLFLGPVLAVYTQHSVGLAFGCSAGMFGAMSIYGYFTKRNLQGMGRMLIMALLGLIVAGVVNIFWGNGTFDLAVSAIGIIVFCLFTAYDTQKILQEGLYCEDEEIRRKGAVMGALALYLDFLNLFLYLLRILGSRD